MKVTELLTERAERGNPRGPQAVWHGATGAARAGQGRPVAPSARWFRLAIAACIAVLAIGAVSFELRNRADLDAAVEVGTATEQPAEEPKPVTPQPARLLIDGMDLERSHQLLDGRPADQQSRATLNRVTIGGSGFDPPIETLVFGSPTDTWTQPILGIELLAGGGFRPWGLNLGGAGLDELTAGLVRGDDGWTMAAGTGLVEMARLTTSSSQMLGEVWQFDFRSGSDTATWQAEPHVGNGLWVWIARTANRPSEPTRTLTESEVLGQPALVLTSDAIDESGQPSDQVFWLDGPMVYRMTAGSIDGDTAIATRASAVTPRLREVDEAAWRQAVSRSKRLTSNTLNTVVDLVLLAGLLIVSLLWLAGGSRRLPALVGPMAVVAWMAVGPLPPFTVFLALALAISLTARQRSMRSFPSGRTKEPV